jgi:hypothetical protein
LFPFDLLFCVLFGHPRFTLCVLFAVGAAEGICTPILLRINSQGYKYTDPNKRTALSGSIV